MSLRGWQVIKPCNNFQNLAFVIFKPFKFSRRHVLTKFSGFHILKPVLFLFDCLSYYDNEHSTEEKTTSVIARKDLKHNLYLKLESAPKKQACQSLWWIYLIGKYLIQTWILTHRTFISFSFDSLQPLQLLQILNDVFAEINPQVGDVWASLAKKNFYLANFLTICLYVFLIEILLKIIIICLSTAQNWSSRWRARTNGKKNVHIFENLEIQAKNRVWKLVSDINLFTPKISSVLFLLSAI